MPQSRTITDFMALGQKYPIIDVRTPAEFAKGHIPGAYNIPLFSDMERAMIGITYKQKGRETAILQGLDLAGPKMRSLLETINSLTANEGETQHATLLMHCWRGGMRSESVAWLAEFYGHQVYTLEGGYKRFRRYILDALESPTQTSTGPTIILGGKTGSGKTEILAALKTMGQQVIDLEGLARHKGSAFGALGQPDPPSQQQFENDLGYRWRNLESGKPVWLEDESMHIGQRHIPKPFWQHMQNALTIFIEVPLDLRVTRLVAEYGQYPPEALAASIDKIQKRLGAQHTQQALTALEAGDLETCCALLLETYYDKAYLHDLARRPSQEIHHLTLDSLDHHQNAAKILTYAQNLLDNEESQS